MQNLKPPGPLALHGNISDNWRRWQQRWNLYAKASGAEKKDEATQCALFLHVIGDDALDVYNSFTFDDSERNKIARLIAKFEAYCSPKKNLTYERYVFNSCTQNGRPFDTFVVDLRNKAKTCEFGAMQDTLIRDRIVCGIDSNTIRERLLRNTDLSLDDAIATVSAAESSKTQLENMNSSKHQVDAVGQQQRSFVEIDNTSKKNPMKGDPCRRCGTVHAKDKCIAYGKTCNKCSGKNHFAKMCFTKSTTASKTSKPRSRIVAIEPETYSDDEQS